MGGITELALCYISFSQVGFGDISSQQGQDYNGGEYISDRWEIRYVTTGQQADITLSGTAVTSMYASLQRLND